MTENNNKDTKLSNIDQIFSGLSLENKQSLNKIKIIENSLMENKNVHFWERYLSPIPKICYICFDHPELITLDELEEFLLSCDRKEFDSLSQPFSFYFIHNKNYSDIFTVLDGAGLLKDSIYNSEGINLLAYSLKNNIPLPVLKTLVDDYKFDIHMNHESLFEMIKSRMSFEKFYLLNLFSVTLADEKVRKKGKREKKRWEKKKEKNEFHFFFLFFFFL